tara:strand:+ start:2103 stop:2213 length:111 start_codon:yes stop_codon:yes gene_type:complete
MKILIDRRMLLTFAAADAVFWFSLGAFIFSGGCDGI